MYSGLPKDADVRCYESQNAQAAPIAQPPPVKVLNGEVTRQEETPFTKGVYCEVWIGRWEKGRGGADGKMAGAEKVGVTLTTQYPADQLLLGDLESTSNTQAAGERA